MSEEQFTELMGQLRILSDLLADTLTTVEVVASNTEDCADRLELLAAHREEGTLQFPPWVNDGDRR